MHRLTHRFFFIAVLLCLGCVLACDLVYAAAPVDRAKRTNKGQAADESDTIRIRRITGVGPNGLVKTPEYDVRNVAKSSAPAQEWGQILVEFETFDKDAKWIDQMTFNFYILLKQTTEDKGASKTPYSLMEGTIVYSDIKRGSDHKCVAYLHPSTLERYGEIVACAVEVSSGTEKIEKSEMSGKAKLQPKWWTKMKDDPQVTTRSGSVLNVLQTPFALANYDDYEAIQQ